MNATDFYVAAVAYRKVTMPQSHFLVKLNFWCDYAVMVNHVRLSVQLRGPLDANRLGAIANALSPVGCQKIMGRVGYRFSRLAASTFGPAGIGRPEPWPDLSEKYQREIGYYGPPKLVLTQNLIRSIQLVDTSATSATVEAECDYAEQHQHGNPYMNLPARPFFPIDGERLTDYAEKELQAEAQKQFEKAIQ